MLGLRTPTLVFIWLFFILGSTATAAIEPGVVRISPVDTPTSSTLDPDSPVVLIEGYSLDGFDLQDNLTVAGVESGESLRFSVESRQCKDECRGSFMLCHCGEPGRNCEGEKSVGSIQTKCRFTIRLQELPADRGPVDFRLLDFQTTLTVPGR